MVFDTPGIRDNVIRIVRKIIKLLRITVAIPRNIYVMVLALINYCKNADFDAVVLCYHYVQFFYRNDGWGGVVSAWKFFWDMFALRKKEVVYFDELDIYGKNQVVLSFDDGYKNFLKFAFPILRFFGYRFELFVIGEYYQNRGGGMIRV